MNPCKTIKTCGNCTRFIDPVTGALTSTGELVFGCTRHYLLLESPVDYDILRSERLSSDRACEDFSLAT